MAEGKKVKFAATAKEIMTTQCHEEELLQMTRELDLANRANTDDDICEENRSNLPGEAERKTRIVWSFPDAWIDDIGEDAHLGDMLPPIPGFGVSILSSVQHLNDP